MKPSRTLLMLLVSVLSLSSGLSVLLAADDEKKTSTTTNAKTKRENAKQTDSQSGKTSKSQSATDSPKDALEQWAKLIARKQEIAKKLQKLRQDFAKSDQEGKKKIRDEFKAAIDEFQQKLFPQMTRIAPAVYEKNPKQFEAGELVTESAYTANQYAKAAATAEKLMADGHRSKFVVNLSGAAYFAVHEFEKAERILDEAAKNGQLDPRSGQRWLKPASDYIAFWKKEQEIRAREAKAEKDQQLPQVLLKTNRGEIVLELFENQAPNTVANFVSLVESKKYDGIKFHRVIPNFMVQGGDPNTLDDNPANDGQGGPGYTIECECYRDDARKHFRGSISMAHAGKDSGGSQFFLTHLPTYWLNADKRRQSGHTVFGRVVKGLEVVDRLKKGDSIVSAKVLRKRNHEYKPKVITNKEPKSPVESKKSNSGKNEKQK